MKLAFPHSLAAQFALVVSCLVALVGVRDSVVVHTADVTMVCPVTDAERVKQLLAAVEERQGPRYS